MLIFRETKYCFLYLLAIVWVNLTLVPNVEASTKFEVAIFVQDSILGGTLSDKTLWMSDTSLSPSHLARHVIAQLPAVPLPYDRTWVVMIDDAPQANFGHPCRWVFLQDDILTNHTIITGKQFPPILTIGTARENFKCRDFTTLGAEPCTLTETFSMFEMVPEIEEAMQFKDCLYAVLISGGINEDDNHPNYSRNLVLMYQILQDCEYPVTNIFTYYADGSDLDLDNADGDGNRYTGTSEVTGAATEENISNTLTDLCTTLNPERDVLFVYVTNHGADNFGICLYDLEEPAGLNDTEIITPEELSTWTANCQIRRLFFVLDQCFSGEFLEPLSDVRHPRSAVYVSASASQFSCGRIYILEWAEQDPAITSMNDMHPPGPWVCYGEIQTPGMAEGTPGIGNDRLCFCWEPYMEDLWAEAFGFEMDLFGDDLILTDTLHYTLYATGVSRTVQGTAVDSGDGLLEIPTEILELNLSGVEPVLGPFQIVESPLRNSTGKIKALQTESMFPAESFFDIYFEVFTGTPLGVLVARDSMRIDAVVDTLFPLDTTYLGESNTLLYQVDKQEGPPAGQITKAIYTPRQRFDGSTIFCPCYTIFGKPGDILTAVVSAETGHEPECWYQVYGPGQIDCYGQWTWLVDTTGQYRVVILNAPQQDSLAQSCIIPVHIPKPGDANGDGEVTISDVVYLVIYLFKSGSAPVPILSVGDANCDGEVNIADAVYLVNYLFKGGSPPC